MKRIQSVSGRAAAQLALTGLLWLGCSPSRSGDLSGDAGSTMRATPCTAGLTVACPCTSGGQGAQTCDPVTGTFGACVCAPADAALPDHPAVDVASAPDAPVVDVASAPDVPVIDVSLIDVPTAPDVSVADVPSPRDAGPLCTPNPSGPARTLDFVIHQVLVDGNQSPSPTARPVFGFNLDNVRSPYIRPPEGRPHCAHGDFSSAIDPDQNGDADGIPCAPGRPGCAGGVDNQLPAFIDALGQFRAGLDFGRLLNDQINRGAGILVIRVSDVNGAPGPGLCDPDVTVRIYRAFPRFAGCASVQSPDQMYAIATSSLTNPADPNSARATLAGSIVNGRLRVHPRSIQDERSSVRLSIPFSGVGDFGFDLRNLQLRLTLNADGSATDGNFGGIQLKREFLAALARIPQLMPFLAAAAPLFDGFTDIATPLGHPGAVCIGRGPSGEEEGGIGLGFGFRALPATLTNVVIDAPAPGFCGSGDAGVR